MVVVNGGGPYGVHGLPDGTDGGVDGVDGVDGSLYCNILKYGSIFVAGGLYAVIDTGVDDRLGGGGRSGVNGLPDGIDGVGDGGTAGGMCSECGGVQRLPDGIGSSADGWLNGDLTAIVTG